MAGIFQNIGISEQLFFSFALGTTVSPALEPFIQFLVNEGWSLNPVVPPNAYVLAEGVAQGQVDPKQAATWASYQGLNSDAFGAIVDVANVGPGSAYAFELWRRRLIDEAGFRRAVRRLGLESEWIDDLVGLHDTLLSSQELAMMQQQGFIDSTRANDEGALQGVTSERQQLRFEASGLPPGIETALQMLRRNIIGNAEFAQIVREGHTKTKYTGELLALQNQVLSAATYVRAHLKGHATQQQMYDGGALTGYKPADLDLWYLTEGRPATAHQIHIGYARGATLPGAANEQDAISIAVKQSDIRPEYTDLIYAGRATYPSLFQLTRLVTGGTISPATGADWAKKSGLANEVVVALEKSWSGAGGATAADTHVAKAQTQLWTTTHRAYLNHKITDAAATAALTAAGVTAAAVPQVLTLWGEERNLDRKPLSAAQVKKAWVEQVVNPDTGVAWTRDEALAYLIELGYSSVDASTFLEL